MVTRSEESMTLNGILSVFLTMVADTSHSLRVTPLTVRRHSERRQACRMKKRESGTMKRSEESVTSMTSYRECRFYQKTKKLSAYR